MNAVDGICRNAGRGVTFLFQEFRKVSKRMGALSKEMLEFAFLRPTIRQCRVLSLLAACLPCILSCVGWDEGRRNKWNK